MKNTGITLIVGACALWGALAWMTPSPSDLIAENFLNPRSITDFNIHYLSHLDQVIREDVAVDAADRYLGAARPTLRIGRTGVRCFMTGAVFPRSPEGGDLAPMTVAQAKAQARVCDGLARKIEAVSETDPTPFEDETALSVIPEKRIVKLGDIDVCEMGVMGSMMPTEGGRLGDMVRYAFLCAAARDSMKRSDR